MESKILIRDAITDKETALFWEQLCTYFVRDIFPDPNDEAMYRSLGFETHLGTTYAHLT